MKTLSLILILLISTFSAFAQTNPNNTPIDDDMIVVGGGAMSDDSNSVKVLLRVDGSLKVPFGSTSDKDGGYFIVATLKSSLDAGGKTLSYVDIKLDAFGLGYFTSTDGKLVHAGDANFFVEASLLRLNYKRNLNLDMGEFLRLSVVGVSMGGAVKATDDLTVYANAALDIAAYSATQRASDSLNVSGKGSGAISGEIGMKFKDRFQIAFGGELIAMKKKIASNSYDTGYDSCHTVNDYSCGNYDYVCHSWYTDEDGYSTCTDESLECTDWYVSDSTTTCTDVWHTDNYYQRSKFATLYAQVSVNITKSLSAFGRAEYVIYQIKEDKVPGGVSNPSTTTPIFESSKSAMQYKAGLVFRF